MTTLALVLDERELRTIEAALLLLQEQINALPEDLSEMMRNFRAPMTETEVGSLARRIATYQPRPESAWEADLPRGETLVEIERAGAPAFALK
jgi:hypothetical protein